MRTILLLDMSFTLKMIRERHLTQALESRQLDGYFDHVISVHPLAGLFETGADRFGQPVVTDLTDSHVFVEGKIGASEFWRFVPPVNLFLAQIRLIRLLFKMAKEKKVDIIRIGDPYYLGLMGWVLSRLLHVPLVIRVCFNYDRHFEVTGRAVFPRLFRYRWLEKLIERFVFPKCALVAGANQNNLDYAIANGAKPETGVVFRYGNLIHLGHFEEPKRRSGGVFRLSELGLDGRFLMTVSRLELIKHSQHNLLVLKELRDMGFDLKLLFVGDGSLRSELERMTQDLNLKEYVSFAGNQSQQWIADVLPKASLVLSPHMGRALVEACLAGVPIVAYDFEWQKELIQDRVTGRLVDEKDWGAMARASADLLNDPDEARRLGQQARAIAMNMMAPDKLTQIEIQAYEAIAGRRHE